MRLNGKNAVRKIMLPERYLPPMAGNFNKHNFNKHVVVFYFLIALVYDYFFLVYIGVVFIKINLPSLKILNFTRVIVRHRRKNHSANIFLQFLRETNTGGCRGRIFTSCSCEDEDDS